MQTINYL